MVTRGRLWAIGLVGLVGALAAGPPMVAQPAPGWVTETVDSAGDVGFYRSLAFSPFTGFPAIGYSDEGKDDVKLAVWNGASWDIQTVDSSRNTHTGISLAYDPTGKPALSYGLGQLKFARWTGSAWSIQTIERKASNNVSSLVFKDGQPSIAYTAKDAIKFARLTGSTWAIETVEGSGAAYPSLAYAPDGNPSIAYKVGDTLKFAHKTGSTWAIQSVETGVYYGVFASLAYDPLTGNPTISHSNGSLTNLRFVRWDGFQWVVEIAATGHATHSSLAYDAAGIAAISYDFAPGTQTNQLWLARRTGCSGTCWETQLIEDYTPSNLAWRTSLAFAPTGAAAISYGNFSARDLKFATEGP